MSVYEKEHVEQVKVTKAVKGNTLTPNPNHNPYPIPDP